MSEHPEESHQSAISIEKGFPSNSAMPSGAKTKATALRTKEIAGLRKNVP
jgi:hypothetical protein